MPTASARRLRYYRRDRLILVAGERGWCLEVHDLAIAKYAAGRQKDLQFTAALARHAMVSREELKRRLTVTPVDPLLGRLIAQRIDADFPQSRNPR